MSDNLTQQQVEFWNRILQQAKAGNLAESQIAALQIFGTFVLAVMMRASEAASTLQGLPTGKIKTALANMHDGEIIGEMRERRKLLLQTGFDPPKSWLKFPVTRRELLQTKGALEKLTEIKDDIEVAILRLEARRAAKPTDLEPVERREPQAAGKADAPTQEWLTVTEAAASSGIPKSSITKLCDNGEIASDGNGRHRRVDPGSLARYKIKLDKERL